MCLNHSVMKINYIKYHNYRCFKDVTVRFDTTEQKNISLVLGVNGSGKTEMLFSFQWVLYGFDFSSMREKEETPYSLNSTLHHRLEVNRHANSEECWVELCFTNKSIEYFVKRTETFMRINDKIGRRIRCSCTTCTANPVWKPSPRNCWRNCTACRRSTRTRFNALFLDFRVKSVVRIGLPSI